MITGHRDKNQQANAIKFENSYFMAKTLIEFRKNIAHGIINSTETNDLKKIFLDFPNFGNKDFCTKKKF